MLEPIVYLERNKVEQKRSLANLIIKNEGDGMVVMQDGSRIEISRAKKDEFLRSIIKDKKL